MNDDTTNKPCACHGHPDGPCDPCIEYECGVATERARNVAIIKAKRDRCWERLVTSEGQCVEARVRLTVQRHTCNDLIAKIQEGNK